MRRTGKTTRIVDRCIQEFFTKGKTYLYENREDPLSESTELLLIFKQRIENEHPHVNFKAKVFKEDDIICYVVNLIEE